MPYYVLAGPKGSVLEASMIKSGPHDDLEEAITVADSLITAKDEAVIVLTFGDVKAGAPMDELWRKLGPDWSLMTVPVRVIFREGQRWIQKMDGQYHPIKEA